MRRFYLCISTAIRLFRPSTRVFSSQGALVVTLIPVSVFSSASLPSEFGPLGLPARKVERRLPVQVDAAHEQLYLIFAILTRVISLHIRRPLQPPDDTGEICCAYPRLLRRYVGCSRRPRYPAAFLLFDVPRLEGIYSASFSARLHPPLGCRRINSSFPPTIYDIKDTLINKKPTAKRIPHTCLDYRLDCSFYPGDVKY